MSKNWKDSNRILYHQDLPHISEIIRIELIGKYYDNLLASYFSNKKTRELVTTKF